MIFDLHDQKSVVLGYLSSILHFLPLNLLSYSYLRPRWTVFLSECIYLKIMHEVGRLKPRIGEIFMKMSLDILCSASIIARDFIA